MQEIRLSAGTIEYEDTGGSGPVIVFLHGLIMDVTLWRHVVAGLRPDYRCGLPTLPLGGHLRPMRPDADLSLRAMAGLVAEFLERLDLRGVTLVGNDWGRAQLLVSEGRAERVVRLVLVSCEAFDNYPPGGGARALALAAELPGGLTAALQPLRFRKLRRLPMLWGALSKRPVPDGVMDGWFRPVLTRREIRRDPRKYVRSVPPKATLLEWAERQRAFRGPVLVVWTPEDRIMPPEQVAGWQSCSRTGGSSRSRTATPSSPRTSPKSSRPESASLCRASPPPPRSVCPREECRDE
jgi:pimeloyl-ACP methyl ester carboxylesterase